MEKKARVCINIDESHHYFDRFDARAAALTSSVGVFVFGTAAAPQQRLCSNRFFWASVFVGSNGGKAHCKQCWIWSQLILPRLTWSHIFLMLVRTPGQRQQTSRRCSLGATVTFFVCSGGSGGYKLKTSIAICCYCLKAFFPAKTKQNNYYPSGAGMTLADGFNLNLNLNLVLVPPIGGDNALKTMRWESQCNHMHFSVFL